MSNLIPDSHQLSQGVKKYEHMVREASTFEELYKIDPYFKQLIKGLKHYSQHAEVYYLHKVRRIKVERMKPTVDQDITTYKQRLKEAMTIEDVHKTHTLMSHIEARLNKVGKYEDSRNIWLMYHARIDELLPKA